MAPAQSTLSSTGAGSRPPVVLKWCIVTKRRGKCYLRFLEAEEQLTVPELMCRIATLCQCKATLSACERVWGCLQLPVVDTIVLAEYPDLEAQGPQRVVVTDQTIHRGLTEVYRDSDGFNSSTRFAMLHPEFAIGGTAASGDGGQRAMLVRRELKWVGVALVAFLVLLVVVVPGLLVGFLTAQPGWGITVSGVVAGLLGSVKLVTLLKGY